MSQQDDKPKKVFFIPNLPNARYDTTWRVQAVVDPNAPEEPVQKEKITIRSMAKDIVQKITMGLGILALIMLAGVFGNWLTTLW